MTPPRAEGGPVASAFPTRGVCDRAELMGELVRRKRPPAPPPLPRAVGSAAPAQGVPEGMPMRIGGGMLPPFAPISLLSLLARDGLPPNGSPLPFILGLALRDATLLPPNSGCTPLASASATMPRAANRLGWVASASLRPHFCESRRIMCQTPPNSTVNTMRMSKGELGSPGCLSETPSRTLPTGSKIG
jgi:hypothetical protein